MYPKEFDELFHFLSNHGFAHSGPQNDTGFGNSFLEFNGQSLVLRMISDRGQFFLEVSLSDRNEWFDIPLLALAINGSGPDIMSPAEQAVFIKNNISKIESLLTTYGSKNLLSRIKTDRAKRRMPGLFR